MQFYCFQRQENHKSLDVSIGVNCCLGGKIIRLKEERFTYKNRLTVFFKKNAYSIDIIY